MSIVPYAGMVDAALKLKVDPTLWVAIGKTTPWTDDTQPPVEGFAAESLTETIAYKKVDFTSLAIPDPLGSIVFQDNRYTLVSDEEALTMVARWCYIKASLNEEEDNHAGAVIGAVTFRQTGLFSGLVPIEDFENDVALTPDQVLDPGRLVFYSNHVPRVRELSLNDTIEIVVAMIPPEPCNTSTTSTTTTTTCVATCQVACQNACQVGSCQTSCQSGAVCQAECQVTCQSGCQTGACQTSCETGSCQTACETGSCQTACQTGSSCQATCEVGCQNCQGVSCQSCQNSCQTTCQNCQGIGCQSCQVGCQTTSCQTICQIGCQAECQGSCQAGCEVGCQDSCQTGCMGFVQLACGTVGESVYCNHLQQYCLEIAQGTPVCTTSCQYYCQSGYCQTACQYCQTMVETGA